MSTLLRLCLDANEGRGVLPCPACGRPLLLAVNRMGRLLIAWDYFWPLRPGAQAMLICSELECAYTEPVEITRIPADAMVFNPFRAASLWSSQEHTRGRTLRELAAEIERLQLLRRNRPNPKLPSLIHFWRNRYRFLQDFLASTLSQGYDSGEEICCETSTGTERGRVMALMEEGVLLERRNTGELVYLPAGDLHSAWMSGGYRTPLRLDFAVPDSRPSGLHAVQTVRRYVVIGGHALSYGGVTRFGICPVYTNDPKAAKELGLMPNGDQSFMGEFPAVLIERTYLLLRYCYVQGYRLYLEAETNDADWLRLETRDLAAARALHMTRDGLWLFGRRRALRWWRDFRRDEIERVEERQITIRRPRWRRR